MSRPRLARAYLAHRYGVLFYSLLLTLAAGPLLGVLDVDRRFILAFLEVNLFAAVFGVSGLPRWRPFQIFFALVVAVRIAAIVFEVPTLEVLVRPLVTTIGFLAAAAALRFALKAQRVTTEHVYAALGAYLLAGVFWGVLHHEIEQVWPGSYVSGGATLAEFSLETGIYFSFVTLATLGYGDIVPRSEVARGITIVEAIAGQLYLAVIMARLVSIYARPATGRVDA